MAQLKATLDAVVKQAEAFMASVEAQGSPTMKKIYEALEAPEDKQEHVWRQVQGHLEELVADLDLIPISREVDKLTQLDTLAQSSEACPVLYTIWSGDGYGKAGPEGVKELEKDLAQHKAQFSVDSVVAALRA